MPSCLPSDYWTTKARVIGVALLLGVMAFDPGAWRRFRPSAFDLPMLGWCLCPMASGLANGVGPVGAMADSAYIFLAWGVPYLAGRIYFFDPEGIATLARGMVAGGLAYVPLCALEFAVGPRFYQWLYGFHPYRTPGMVRYVGYRPVVFLEDGNELGIWLAASAMTACWLWRSGRLRRFCGMPGWLVASALVAQSLLSQSAGAAFLLVAGLASMECLRRFGRVWPLAAVAAVVLLLVAARAANLFDAKALAMSTGLGRRLVGRLDPGRSSVLRLEAPSRGAGGQGGAPEAMAGLGTLGLVAARGGRREALGAGQPGLRELRGDRLGPPAGLPHGADREIPLPRAAPVLGGPVDGPGRALAGALIIIGLDAILNPCLFLPFSAVAGGLVGLDRRPRPARAPIGADEFSFHRWIDRRLNSPIDRRPPSGRPRPSVSIDRTRGPRISTSGATSR